MIDWEWAYIAPPETEFVRLEAYGYPKFSSLRIKRIYKEAFIAGYEEINPLSKHHEQLIKIYRILFHMYWAKIEFKSKNYNRCIVEKYKIEALINHIEE